MLNVKWPLVQHVHYSNQFEKQEAPSKFYCKIPPSQKQVLCTRIDNTDGRRWCEACDSEEHTHTQHIVQTQQSNNQNERRFGECECQKQQKQHK